MRIGDIVADRGVEWTVVGIDEKGNPLTLRTMGAQRNIHPGAVIDKLGTPVKALSYDPESGFTEIRLPNRLSVPK